MRKSAAISPGVTYVLPKDLPEQSRLDFQHYLLYAVLGTHAGAPVGKSVHHILDVATGTGRWAHEMAQTFPNAQVIGLDMEEPVTPIESPRQLYLFCKAISLPDFPLPIRHLSMSTNAFSC